MTKWHNPTVYEHEIGKPHTGYARSPRTARPPECSEAEAQRQALSPSMRPLPIPRPVAWVIKDVIDGVCDIMDVWWLLYEKATAGNIDAIQLLLAYYYGKPIERVEHSGHVALPVVTLEWRHRETDNVVDMLPAAEGEYKVLGPTGE